MARSTRWPVSPLSWTAIGVALFPLAWTVAPRLQRPPPPPRIISAPTPPPLARPAEVDPTPDPIHRDPANAGILGTYVWEGCTLRLAEGRGGPGLHVRTGYVHDDDLPGLLAEVDAAGVPGIHLGFYTAPRSLEPLRQWRDLRYLTFEGDHLTDEAMAPLAQLTGLKMLEIGVRPYESNEVTDAGLAHLSGLTQLEYLGIHAFEGVWGPGLAHLSGLARLEQLELSYTEVGDGALAHLSGLTRLKTLSLQHTRVTDAGLQHLAKLPNLHTLDLRQTAVTPAVAPLLASFPALQRVVLHYNQQFDVIEAVRSHGLRADGQGWIRGTVGCGDWGAPG